jgi:L-fucose isomerase-like protein
VLGVRENSVLDLFKAFNQYGVDHIPTVVLEWMKSGELATPIPVFCKAGQYESTLKDWAEKFKGASEYVVCADKCWPAFQTQFGFVPCCVNSKLASIGIPVACDPDIYGA